MQRVLIRGRRRAISAVVGTILMVAVTVALAVVMFVFVAPLVSSPPPPKPQITLLPGNWNNGTITLSFGGLSHTENIVPSDLRYIVQAQNGTIYFSGPAGSANPVGTVNVTIEYLDAGAGGRVSGEDLIRVRVNPEAQNAVRGCAFKILLGADLIGNIAALP